MCYIKLTCQVLRSATEQSTFLSILGYNFVVGIRCSERHPSSVRRPLRTQSEIFCFFAWIYGFLPARVGGWLFVCWMDILIDGWMLD